MDGDLADAKPQICKEFSLIEEHYILGELLGEGAYANVYEARPAPPPPPKEGEEEPPEPVGAVVDKPVAVKVVKKRKKGIVHAVREEIDLLKECAHTNVLQFIDVLESEFELYVVTELLSGGSLMDRIVGGGVTTEQMASNIFRQIAFALAHLHGKKIMHRDIKPQNILFVDGAAHSRVKLIDFGAAIRVKKDDVNDRQVGTVKFMAPEMVSKHEYSFPVDLWSLGVVLYLTLSGLEPFTGQGTALYASIRAGKYDTTGPAWEMVTADPIGLLKGLLEYKPDKRITAEDVTHHPWVWREKDKFLKHSIVPRDATQPLPRKKFVAREFLIGAIRVVEAANHLAYMGRHPRPKPPEVILYPAMRGGGGGGLSARSEGGSARVTKISPGRISRAPVEGGGGPMSSGASSSGFSGAGGSLCIACGMPAGGGDTVEVGGCAWHSQCFRCWACGGGITSSYAEGSDGMPYHAQCLEGPHTTNRPEEGVCCMCGKKCISGIKALGRTFHDTCFVCAICRAPITEEANYEECEGKPHHRTCLNRSRAQDPWQHGAPLHPSGDRIPSPSLSTRSAMSNSSMGSHHVTPHSAALGPSSLRNRPISPNTASLAPPLAQPGYRSPMMQSRHSHGSGPPSLASLRGSQEGTARSVSSYDDDQQSVLSLPSVNSSLGGVVGAGGGGHFKSRFCHSCGAKHATPTARFCLQCGEHRV